MPNDLNLNTVELTSTLRTAPLNGSPSSSDYNESQRENLVDLSAVAGFINNTLLPLLNALPAGGLLPTQDPVGIEGRTIWTDTSDQSTLFFDSLDNIPLTIADTIRVINGIVTTMQQTLIDQGVEVASLQARLASTNQNDIALALQNLSSALNSVTVNQQIQNTSISQIQGTVIIAKQSTATTIPAGSSANITITFDTPFDDDFYTVSLALEIPAGANPLVSLGGFKKTSTGVGIVVAVSNFDIADASVIVHVMSQKNSGA